MAVWRLESDTNFTEFSFPLEEDQNFFRQLVKESFDEAKPLSSKWRPLHLLRGEPRKHPDFFEIDDTGVIAVSSKSLHFLRDFLNAKIETLPIETDAGRYYALNVLNFVDCLNKRDSDCVATKEGLIVNYSLLEFDPEKLGHHSIFKIPELPYQTFVSDDIQEQCEEENLQGLLFDAEVNLVWYPE